MIYFAHKKFCITFPPPITLILIPSRQVPTMDQKPRKELSIQEYGTNISSMNNCILSMSSQKFTFANAQNVSKEVLSEILYDYYFFNVWPFFLVKHLE